MVKTAIVMLKTKIKTTNKKSLIYCNNQEKWGEERKNA